MAGGNPEHLTLSALVEIWAAVLRQPAVGPDDNFFDLGGDSLLALALFARLAEETGQELPITTIYDAPTPAELHRLLLEERRPPSALLVPLKPGAGAPPLFVVHGIGGTVIELARLGRSLAHPGPVYAIQAPGLDGLRPPLDTIEGMADEYMNAVQEVQPRGPYLLAGYSFGGLVALELARRLGGAGGNVELVALIDAYPHPDSWPLPVRVDMRRRWAWDRLRSLLTGSRAEAAAYIRQRVKERAARPLARRRLFPIDPALPVPVQKVAEAGETALERYRPAAYPGPVLFLKAARTMVIFPRDPTRIWQPLAGEITVRTVPGTHLDLVDGEVAALAAELDRGIVQALASEGARPKATRAFEHG